MSKGVFTIAELKNRSDCLQRIVDHVSEAEACGAADELKQVKAILKGFHCWTPYTGEEGDLP